MVSIANPNYPKHDIDLGFDHLLSFTRWTPDRSLNPQFADLPDVEKWGAIIEHPDKEDGSPCVSAITFDGEVQSKIVPDRHRWTVQSWDPLTISPSLLCGLCKDHGFIQNGKWVKA